MLIIKLQKNNSVRNYFFIPKTLSSKINLIENNYNLSKMEILTQENQVKTQQFQLQKSYHTKENRCDNFILVK